MIIKKKKDVGLENKQIELPQEQVPQKIKEPEKDEIEIDFEKLVIEYISVVLKFYDAKEKTTSANLWQMNIFFEKTFGFSR